MGMGMGMGWMELRGEGDVVGWRELEVDGETSDARTRPPRRGSARSWSRRGEVKERGGEVTKRPSEGLTRDGG